MIAEPAPSTLFRSYGLACFLLSEFLPGDWIQENISATPGTSGYLRCPIKGNGSAMQKHMLRVINLAETLFNLQTATGFDAVLAQLQTASIEDTSAELESGRMLWIHHIDFRFVVPQHRRGFDYDLEVHMPDLQWVCAETKNKAETTKLSRATVLNSLKTARKRNLPSDRPSFVFMRVPEEWLAPKVPIAPLEEGVADFFRGTTEIASVKLHSFITYDAPDGVGQALSIREFSNDRCRFLSPPSGWNIFPSRDTPHTTERWTFIHTIVTGHLPTAPVKPLTS